MILAAFILAIIASLLSSYAALSVLMAQIAGGRWMRTERRALPRTIDLRRAAAARKGWATRRKSEAE